MSENGHTGNYKLYHEDFMKNQNGTSAAEIFLVVMPAPLCIFLSNCIFALVIYLINDSKPADRLFQTSGYLIDFILIVIPQILCFTVLNEFHATVTVILLVGVFLCTVFRLKVGADMNKNYIHRLLTTEIKEYRRPYVTNLRALTNLMTAICILAVDFKVFPRRFAKTESFGYGLMDTGVGLYVLSNAIVAPEPQVHPNKAHSFKLSMWKSLKSTMPLFILGGARFFATKQIDYQMHISEYGVHWNFFITLAVSKIICTMILIFVRTTSMLLPVTIIIVHEIILKSGIQSWVLSNIPRDNFITANREGIVSSLGYVALYLAGVCVGKELKKTKSSFENNLIALGKLIIVSLLLWPVNSLCKHCFGVSRRLANIGYFTWLLALGVTMLVIFMGIELLTRAFNEARNNKENMNTNIPSIQYVPVTLEAINYNGLAFFILANLLTGLVNICFYTLYLNAFLSFIIICSYCFILCSITVLLYYMEIKLKIW